MSKSERQHTAFMQVELVLVRLGDMQNLHVTVLHPHRQPLTRWAITQREDLQPNQTRNLQYMIQGEQFSQGKDKKYTHNSMKNPINPVLFVIIEK